MNPKKEIQETMKTEEPRKDATLTDDQLTQLDRALNAAKARKERRSGSSGGSEQPAQRSRANREATRIARELERAVRKTEREKAKVERVEARERAKAERKAAREARKAAREAARGSQVPHMGKVDRAAERLPVLTEDVQRTLEDLIVTYDLPTLTGLAAHIQHRVRAEATRASLERRLEVGQRVTVVAGDPRHVGQVGTVSRVQRIRCYVLLPGVEKPVYCFTSDVAPAAEEVAKTG